jgi:hypothetical protein
MEDGRSTRVRGTPNAEQLKAAQKKYKSFDDYAATEWKRLKDNNQRKSLTPETDACNHARWVHFS